MPRTRGRAYKEITFQQLRSFCETARLGSLTAAAKSLDLAHPTVWKQVHALERELGTTLVEPHGRGCRLTEAGRVLAELAEPAVLSIASLKRNFLERLDQTDTRLVVASSPRVLVDDLPECVVEFERRHPQVRLTLKEIHIQGITESVESGEADVGLTTEPSIDHPRLEFEPGYQLEVHLITRDDHPLARKRTVRPEDLLPYPLVNAPAAFPNPVINERLAQLGLFRSEPRRVEAYYAAAIRRYVQMGFGIGLMGGLPGRLPQPGFHERSMARYFGGSVVSLVWRKGAPRPASAAAFAETIKNVLGRAKPASKQRKRQRRG